MEALTGNQMDNLQKLGLLIYTYSNNMCQYINVDCCEKIDTYAFSDCCSLTLFNGPLVKYIGYGAFRYCEKLKSIKTPKLKNIITDALEYCQNLINIESLLSDDQLKNAFSDNELYTKYIKQRDRNIKISKLIQN